MADDLYSALAIYVLICVITSILTNQENKNRRLRETSIKLSLYTPRFLRSGLISPNNGNHLRGLIIEALKPLLLYTLFILYNGLLSPFNFE